MRDMKSAPILPALHHRLQERAAAMIDRGLEPHVAVVLVGNDEASLEYVSRKDKRAKEDGIIFSLYHLEEELVSFDDVAKTIDFLGADKDIHGIVLQLPLPDNFTDAQVTELIGHIPAEKDVDGLKGDWTKLTYTTDDSAKLAAPQQWALPPMIMAVLSLLDYYNVSRNDKKIVLVGRGRLVGTPLEVFFQKLGFDVTSVDEETDDILDITKQADILITGTGQPDLITYQWVKEGAVVVDCSGDVHTGSVEQVAEALSPAQGGIGPLTVAWLLHNVLNAAEATHV